ncbi:ATP synthase F0 subunit B [bacterium]|nr:ATP synthase F0 subunit B [bacterium]
MLQFNATFIVAIISFVVFIMIMNTIFYKPVLNVIEERENFIRGNYDEANATKEKADNLLQDKETRLNETYKNAKQILTDNKIQANLSAQEMIANAKSSSDAKINSEKERIETEKNSTDINAAADELSQAIVDKILEGVR